MTKILQMSNREYHDDTSRISKSGLDLIGRSPLHYYRRYLAEERDAAPDSKALIMGSAVHAAILEPAVFEAEFCRGLENCDRRTKEGKEQYQNFLNASGGKQVLTPEDFADVLTIRDAVLAHPVAARLLSEGTPEGVLYFDYPASSFPLDEGESVEDFEAAPAKIRFDFLHSSGTVLVDIKTTEDASPEAFQRSVAKYNYHKQAALYTDAFAFSGLPVPDKFVFIAVEKSAPYAVGVYLLATEAVEVGRGEVAAGMKTYSIARKTGNWAGYTPTKIVPITLPAWAFSK